MTLPRATRNNLWKILSLISERDMPSNCTVERLVTRSGLPEKDVLQALDILWDEDQGWVRVHMDPRSKRRGYFTDPSHKSKTPMDLDSLYDSWEARFHPEEEEDEEEDV